jgi:hypothetical protein
MYKFLLMMRDRLSYLAHLRDVQTLGVIACLLEMHRRCEPPSSHFTP